MEIKLYYKEFLINQEKTAVGALFIRQVMNYLDTLNITCTKENAIDLLHNINDNNYCGVGIVPEHANFIMYKQNVEFYWFVNPYDAIMFVNYQNNIKKDCALEGYPQSSGWSTYFDRYRGHCERGYWWLYKDDVEYLDEIISAPKKIWCESRRLEFLSVEDAARWLVQIGKAANMATATRQLTKNLSGQTGSCYGLVFKEY